MAIDTSVKVFTSAMTGTPVLNGVAGSLLSILDACLVDGWGTLPIASLTVASGVATVNFSSPHPYIKNAVVRISGASQSQINGDWKVDSVVSVNSISFLCPGLSDGVMSGTMTGAMAPAGWKKKFSDTNIRCYQSQSVLSTGGVLRIDDTGTQAARVVAYESMSDVNTGVGPAPTTAQASGGGYWAKSDTAGTTARDWAIVADDRFFIIFLKPIVNSNGAIYCAGDEAGIAQSDPYGFVLASERTGTFSSSIGTLSSLSNSNSCFFYCLRASNGYGGAVALGRYAAFMIASSAVSGANYGSWAFSVFPNYPNNGVILSPVYIVESLGLRGVIPGYYATPQTIGKSTLDNFNQIVQNNGKSYMSLSTSDNGGYNGLSFVDVTGPWR